MILNFDPAHQLKAAMRVIANLITSSSDEDTLDDIRDTGENPENVANKVRGLFNEAFNGSEANPSLSQSGERVSSHSQFLQRIRDGGLLPCSGSFDVVWRCIVEALRGLGIDRIRLYLLSEDEQFLVAIRHYGMGNSFIGQRRWFRSEPHLDVLSDGRLHLFERVPGQPAPFESGVPDETPVPEWFCVLLTWENKVVAKLSGDCGDSCKPLVLANLRAIELFAPLLANAINHARLLTNLASVQQLSAAAISSDTPLKGFTQDICRAVENIPGVDHSQLLLFNTDPSAARIKAQYPVVCTRKAIPLRGSALVKQLASSCRPLFIDDVRNNLDLGPLRELLGKLEIQSLLIVPIVSAGQLVGALTLESRKLAHRFQDAEITLATIYASQVAVAFEHRRRYKALRRLDEVVEAMLIASNYESLAQLIADEARKLFGASFAVFRPCANDSCPCVLTTPVFSAGITALDWQTIEAHEDTRSRLLSALQVKGWVEIASRSTVRQVLPRLEWLPEILGFQAMSLKTRDDVGGVLFLAYSRRDALNAEQRRRARKFVAFAALSLQRVAAASGVTGTKPARRDERLREHLLAFYEANKIITTSASSGVPATAILDHILKYAVECTKAGKDKPGNLFGTIWSFDGISSTLTLESAYPRGVLISRPVGYTYAIFKEFGSIGVTGRAAIMKALQNVPYVPVDTDYIQFDSSTLSELAVPILDGDTLLGILNIESDRENAFDTLDEDAVAALAGLAAIAIEHSRQGYAASALEGHAVGF
jgi:GAF domain-containing protein